MAANERRLPQNPDEWAAWTAERIAAHANDPDPGPYDPYAGATAEQRAKIHGPVTHEEAARPVQAEPKAEEWELMRVQFYDVSPMTARGAITFYAEIPGPLTISGVGAEHRRFKSTYAALAEIIAKRTAQGRTTAIVHAPGFPGSIRGDLERQGGGGVYADLVKALRYCTLTAQAD